MTPEPLKKDLVVLTADKNARFALQGLLSRGPALAIREITCDYFVHPEKDPGVLRHAHEFLKPFVRSHEFALVVMDREGSGREGLQREVLEREIEDRLDKSGWGTRTSAIVVDPELDVWVWSDSPHVVRELGWMGRSPGLQEWLLLEGWLEVPSKKPPRPKEALEAALREVRKPRSSAIYQALAEKVSLSRCTDAAFEKLKDALAKWFGAV